VSELIVAVDGPAGSGKSSVSKKAAAILGFGYLDTGAAYRAMTVMILDFKKHSFDDLADLDLDSEFSYSISTEPENYWVKLANLDISDRIRDKDVEENVSLVARIPAVRSFMMNLTRQLAKNCSKPGIIVEGRDITTVVAPDAQIRVLLTASEEVRLKRRSLDLGELDKTQLTRQVSDRDKSDSDIVEFQKPAPGVTLLDTSELGFDETVEALVATISTGL
jgi:cytidylate kinase